MKKFRCKTCGYEYEGDHPVECPICAAPIEEQEAISM